MKKLSLILTIIAWGYLRSFQSTGINIMVAVPIIKRMNLLHRAWLEKNSAQKWKADTPLGFSSFSCEGSKAFTLI